MSGALHWNLLHIYILKELRLHFAFHSGESSALALTTRDGHVIVFAL